MEEIATKLRSALDKQILKWLLAIDLLSELISLAQKSHLVGNTYLNLWVWSTLGKSFPNSPILKEIGTVVWVSLNFGIK